MNKAFKKYGKSRWLDAAPARKLTYCGLLPWQKAVIDGISNRPLMIVGATRVGKSQITRRIREITGSPRSGMSFGQVPDVTSVTGESYNMTAKGWEHTK